MIMKAVRKKGGLKKAKTKKAKKAEYELSYVNHFWNNMIKPISSSSDVGAKRAVRKMIADMRKHWKKDHIKATRLVRIIPLA